MRDWEETVSAREPPTYFTSDPDAFDPPRICSGSVIRYHCSIEQFCAPRYSRILPGAKGPSMEQDDLSLSPLQRRQFSNRSLRAARSYVF